MRVVSTLGSLVLGAGLCAARVSLFQRSHATIVPGLTSSRLVPPILGQHHSAAKSALQRLSPQRLLLA